MKQIRRTRKCRRIITILVVPTVTLAVSLSPVSSLSASGTEVAPPNDLPPGLQPTQVNVTNDATHRFGEPEVAVNPKNPNNLVYIIMSNRSTYSCESALNPLCAPLVAGSPVGAWTVPGWWDAKVYVSFDRGNTWDAVNFDGVPAVRGFPGEGTDHSDLLSKADPMMTVTADGTFYIGWDAFHFCHPGVGSCLGAVDAGIAVSRSTDGGRTWSTPVLTGTGVDRPWMTAALSTGTVYEASSGPINAAVSNGNPNLPIGGPSQPSDRWVVASPDGVDWTAPQRLGGGSFSGASGATISAAGGELAAGFLGTSAPACTFFVGLSAGKCVVFETSVDSGMTWSRHAVPAPSGVTGNVLVAADPAQAGTFTVAVLNSTSSDFSVFVTHDDGVTWSGPTTVTDNPSTVKFKTWINYSPQGVVGLAWRSATVDPAPDTATAPETVDPVSTAATTQDGDENNEDPPDVPYTIQAAISNDQGSTWSTPLQISTAPSPASDPLWAASGDRDDTSVIALSNQSAFIGWGDWRPGDVQGFFSAVKLQTFTH
jgi:hypothetical protein